MAKRITKMFDTITKVSSKLKLSTKILLLAGVIVAIIGVRFLLFSQVYLDGGIVGKPTVKINAPASAVLDEKTGCANVNFDIVGVGAKGQMVDNFKMMVYEQDVLGNNSAKPIRTEDSKAYLCGFYASSCTWTVPISFCSAKTYDIQAIVYAHRMYDTYTLSGTKAGSTSWAETIPGYSDHKKVDISGGGTGTPTVTSPILPPIKPGDPPTKETGSVSFTISPASPAPYESFKILVNAVNSAGIKAMSVSVGGQLYQFSDSVNPCKSCSRTLNVGGLSAGSYSVSAWARSISDTDYTAAEQNLIIKSSPPPEKDPTVSIDVSLPKKSVFFGESMVVTVDVKSSDKPITWIELYIGSQEEASALLTNDRINLPCAQEKECIRSWTINFPKLPAGKSIRVRPYIGVDATLYDGSGWGIHSYGSSESFILSAKSNKKPIIQTLQINGVNIYQTTPLTVISTSISKSDKILIKVKGENPLGDLTFDTSKKTSSGYVKISSVAIQSNTCDDFKLNCTYQWAVPQNIKGTYIYAFTATDAASLTSVARSVTIIKK